MRLRVLTWNLMHGRSVPPASRDLLQPFATALQGWEWDVALLQEVPSWWPARLAAALAAEYRLVLTSRNELFALRRLIAARRPDLMRSNRGGANAILARRDRIVAHRSERLCRLPERRWVHGVRLACGIWVANLHTTAGDEARAARDTQLAAASATAWARGEPLVLGGDFNLPQPELERLRLVASDHGDHISVSPQLDLVAPAEGLQRGELSDHAPLAATLDWPQ